MSKFSRALWERYKRGYVAIGIFLLALSVALLKGRGWAVLISIWALLLIGLEWLYRKVQSLVKKHKSKWWAKPRGATSRAYVELAAAILAVLIASQAARYWAVATAVGAVLVALGIRWYRVQVDEDPPRIFGTSESSSGGDGTRGQ
jgi:hypothetical protein